MSRNYPPRENNKENKEIFITCRGRKPNTGLDKKPTVFKDALHQASPGGEGFDHESTASLSP